MEAVRKKVRTLQDKVNAMNSEKKTSRGQTRSAGRVAELEDELKKLRAANEELRSEKQRLGAVVDVLVPPRPHHRTQQHGNRRSRSRSRSHSPQKHNHGGSYHSKRRRHHRSDHRSDADSGSASSFSSH